QPRLADDVAGEHDAVGGQVGEQAVGRVPGLEHQLQVDVAQVQVQPVAEDDLGHPDAVVVEQREGVGVDAGEQVRQVLVAGRLVQQPLAGPAVGDDLAAHPPVPD